MGIHHTRRQRRPSSRPIVYDCKQENGRSHCGFVFTSLGTAEKSSEFLFIQFLCMHFNEKEVKHRNIFVQVSAFMDHMTCTRHELQDGHQQEKQAMQTELDLMVNFLPVFYLFLTYFCIIIIL